MKRWTPRSPPGGVGSAREKMVEATHELDAASASPLLGATISQADGKLYIVGGHDTRGPPKPEVRAPLLLCLACVAHAHGRKRRRRWTRGSR